MCIYPILKYSHEGLTPPHPMPGCPLMGECGVNPLLVYLCLDYDYVSKSFHFFAGWGGGVKTH